jgi:hypothetical protein
MCENKNLFGVPGIPPPAGRAAKPLPPLTGRQGALLEEWQKLGFTSLFDCPATGRKEVEDVRK